MSGGFGPLGARASLVRPSADVDAYSQMQTWFKDCSAPGASDGSVPDASWFNHIIGNLVYAAAKAGVTLANNQSDDSYLWQIIQAAIAQALSGSGGSSGGSGSGGTGGGSGGAWTLI